MKEKLVGALQCVPLIIVLAICMAFEPVRIILFIIFGAVLVFVSLLVTGIMAFDGMSRILGNWRNKP